MDKGESTSRGYEETVFIAELTGLFELDLIEEALKKNNYEFKELEDGRIVCKIGSQIFLGSWEEVLGTDVIIDTQEEKCVGTSIKRLICDRTILERKEEEEDDAMDTTFPVDSAPADDHNQPDDPNSDVDTS
uniref:TFIIIC_sub6 domain-containing protein n=1 Tax=Trichuris muris TaxID=70415 RepID=A0A5S6Q644_TRIMR